MPLSIHVYRHWYAHADTPKQTTHDVAIEAINGNYGTGQERVSNVDKQRFLTLKTYKQKLTTFC